MKPTTPTKVVLALTALFFLCGCATTQQTAEKKESKNEEDEYVTYYATGSLLPKRVKRSQAKQENLVVEGPDSPTLNQIEKTQMIQEQKRFAGSGPR